MEQLHSRKPNKVWFVVVASLAGGLGLVYTIHQKNIVIQQKNTIIQQNNSIIDELKNELLAMKKNRRSLAIGYEPGKYDFLTAGMAEEVKERFLKKKMKKKKEECCTCSPSASVSSRSREDLFLAY